MGERLTKSIIERNHATAAHSRRLASRKTGDGKSPLAGTGQRSARNELAADAIRAQAVSEGIDVSTLRGERLTYFVGRAVDRIRKDPGMMARATAAGATIDDYLSAAHALQRRGTMTDDERTDAMIREFAPRQQ